MRRRVRRLSIAFSLVGLVVLAGYTGAWAWFNDATLGQFISAQVNRAERGQFLLGHARFTWAGGLLSLITNVPTRVVGQDYRLLDPDGSVVLVVPYVEADIHLRSLVVSLVKMAVTQRFYLDLHFTRAWVPSGLAVITDTRSTWGKPLAEINIVAAMSKRLKTPYDGGEFRITVEDLQIDDVNFALGLSNLLGRTSWYGRFWSGAGHAALVYSSRLDLETRDGPYFFFKVKPMRSTRGEIRLGDFIFPLESLNALEFGPGGDARQRLTFDATSRSLGSEIHIGGALVDAYSERPGVQLKLDFQHGAGPLKLLPPPLDAWLGGDPEGELRVDGPFTEVVVEADVRGGEAVIEGVPLHKISTRLRLASDGVLRFDPTQGSVAGGKVAGSVEVDLAPERAAWRARISLHDVDPSQIPALPKELAPKLAGKLNARFRLFGSLVEKIDHISVDDIDGTLERSAGANLPRRLHLGGGVEIQTSRVALRDVQLAADGLTVTATGGVERPSGTIDAKLLVDGHASAAMHSFGLPGDLRVDTVHAFGSVGGRWPRPRLVLHVAAVNAGWGWRVLDRLEADVSLVDGVLQFDQVRGKGLGGTVGGWAHLGLFAADGDLTRPLAAPTLGAQLDAQTISVGGLSGAPVLDGAANFHLSLDGPLERPRGHGVVELPKLAIFGDPYQDGRATLDVGDDGWTIREIRLTRRGGGMLRGTGHIGWDLSYALKLSPSDFPIAAFPHGADTPFDGRVSGQLSLDGEGAHWRIGGLAQLNGFTFRKALIGDGQLRFEPGGDASSVRGSAFRHFTIDGTLTTWPKFAISVNLVFTDLPLENIFPEARQLVDVTATTSGSAHVSFSFASGISGTVTLDKVQATLAGTEEDGRVRHLVVHNSNPVVINVADGVGHLARTELTSQLGNFVVEAPSISKDGIDASMKGQIGLELLEYFFKSWFEHTDGNAYVDLKVKGPWAAPQLLGAVDLNRVSLQPRGLDHRLNVTAGHVDFTQSRVTLSNFDVNMDGAIAHATGSVALDGWKPGAVAAQVKGQLSAKLLQWLFADRLVESSGRVFVDVTREGELSHPRWQGSARVDGNLNLQIRRFDHELSFTKGSLQFIDHDLTLGCPKGAARAKCEPIVGLIDGTSSAMLDGTINFGEDLAPRTVDLSFSGSEIRHTTQVYTLVMSPRVRLLSLDGQHYELSGSVQMVEGRYTQKFDTKDWVVKPRAVEKEEPWWEGDPRLETLKLSLKAQATGPLTVDVGWARLTISTASLDIAGTLSDPRLQGEMLLDEGGTIQYPVIMRIPFISDAGRIYFSQEKRIPDETPTLDLLARGICTDRLDNQHEVQLQISGTITDLKVLPRSIEGWDQSAIAFCVFSGHTQEDVRRLTQGGGTDPSGVRNSSATEAITKTGTAAVFGDVLTDPIKKLTGFDTASLEVGGSSVAVKACKRLQRYLKACGQGDLGFVGGSRAQADLQLRVSDYISGLARIEYLSQGIDTLQDVNTRLKLELNYRIPLGY